MIHFIYLLNEVPMKVCPDTTTDSPPDYEETVNEMYEHPHDSAVPMPVIPKQLHEDDIVQHTRDDHLPPLFQPKPIIDLEQEFKSQSQLPSPSNQFPDIVPEEEEEPMQVKQKKKRSKEEKRLRKEHKRKW